MCCPVRPEKAGTKTLAESIDPVYNSIEIDGQALQATMEMLSFHTCRIAFHDIYAQLPLPVRYISLTEQGRATRDPGSSEQKSMFSLTSSIAHCILTPYIYTVSTERAKR
jgi:hypothetical protein